MANIYSVFTRSHPGRVTRPTIIEQRMIVNVEGRELIGKGYALPDIEELVVTIVKPHGSKAKNNACGWSIWLGDHHVYHNIYGSIDTMEQAISVAMPRLVAAYQQIKSYERKYGLSQ